MTSVANNPCGAKIPCGDLQVFFAYAVSVGGDAKQQKAIGDRISEAMARLDISISELGLAWGGHRQTAQHWVHGRSMPPAAELPRLCRMLLLDANEMFGFTPLSARAPQEIEQARKAILIAAQATRERHLKRKASPGMRLAKHKRTPSRIQGRLGS